MSDRRFIRCFMVRRLWAGKEIIFKCPRLPFGRLPAICRGTEAARSLGCPTSTIDSVPPPSATTSISRFRPVGVLGMQVMSFIDEQRDRLPAAAEQLLKVAFTPLTLRGYRLIVQTRSTTFDNYSFWHAAFLLKHSASSMPSMSFFSIVICEACGQAREAVP
jgi:hypothetical protein